MLLANDPVFLPWHAQTFEMSLGAAAAFGLLGIFLLVLGFKIFELVTPRVDLEKELAEKNLAVGIVVGALLVGIALIVSRAIAG
jgi:putative membrane protein